MLFGQEKRITRILVQAYKNQGWVLFEEFAIPGTILNLRESTRRPRPDILGLREGQILIIEVENAPFVHHPTIYTNLANYCYLAYPAASEQTLTQQTIDDQIRYAQKKGIGILKVNDKGKIAGNQVQVIELLPAVKREIHPKIKARIVNLAWNRYIREETTVR